MAARVCVALLVLLTARAADACLFARTAEPQQWYEWSKVLFAGNVSEIRQDGALDIITVEVIETFKGPPAARSATVQVPNRMWTSCRLELPSVGTRVLVAMNSANDALVLPLSDAYAGRLRAHKK